jgi:NAD(P)-dependent dehydrogenase (short-subunit alcohol dehydrogenase family)
LIQASDVSNVEDVAQLTADTVRRFGRIDILVNNAGVGGRGAFLDLPVQDWHRVFGINIDGIFNMTRSILPHLIETKGAIINVSSMSGLGGDRGLSFYNAAKGAVSNLTRGLALEFGPRPGSLPRIFRRMRMRDSEERLPRSTETTMISSYETFGGHGRSTRDQRPFGDV